MDTFEGYNRQYIDIIVINVFMVFNIDILYSHNYILLSEHDIEMSI